MATNILRLPGARELPRGSKVSRSIMDTIEVTADGVSKWKRPPFQRELRITPKVRAVVDEISDSGGVIPGIITLGKVGGDTYLLDGQHRIEAFVMSGLATGYCDARICTFESMSDMGEEFVNLNSHLVSMRNDDIVRALEGTNPRVAQLRRECPFLGYSSIRDGKGIVMMSMATAIRVWSGCQGDTPTMGASTPIALEFISDNPVDDMTKFFRSCFEAWGRDAANYRMWGATNIGVLIWLWRRIVLCAVDYSHRRGGVKPSVLTDLQWRKCIMALASDATYSDWLVGRRLADRDRTPCYARIRAIFVRRLAMDDCVMKSPKFPHEDWTK